MSIFRKPNQMVQKAQPQVEGNAAQMQYTAQPSAKPDREYETRMHSHNIQVEKDADEFAKKVPSFNMDEEMKNPTFRYYIWSLGLSLEEAYLLVHKDEVFDILIGNQSVKNTARIPENGAGRIYPATTRQNFSEMSDEEIDAIAKRVEKGERVTLD